MLAQLAYQLPLLVLVGGGSVLLILEAFTRGSGRRYLMHLAAAVTVIAMLAVWLTWKRVTAQGEQTLFDGMVVVDKYSLFLTLVFCFACFLATLLTADFMREYAVLYGEIYPLLLFTTAGMAILASAGDLVSVFLGIETMSLGAYVLTGAFRRAKAPAEAAMKYFITGAFATGFLLYGIALIYGATGTTNLAAIGAAKDVQTNPLFLIGIFMLIVAFGFKIAAVPFHMWAPDTYEGAPTPITGFMAAGIKAAGIAGLLRVFMVAFGTNKLPIGHLGWTSAFFVIAIASMTVGNLAALRQENVKRMLAYSSIAHAGYLLVGVVGAGVAADQDVARPAILYYLLAYTFTTIGAFGVVAWVGYKREMIDDWAGLGARHPAAAAAMTIFMLSLGGLPPTGGFFGKFYVFRAAMEDSQLVPLVVVAVINSVVSMYYYLRVVMTMYFREPTRELKPLRSTSTTIALALCAIAVLGLGLLPSSWLGRSTAATILGLGVK